MNADFFEARLKDYYQQTQEIPASIRGAAEYLADCVYKVREVERGLAVIGKDREAERIRHRETIVVLGAQTQELQHKCPHWVTVLDDPKDPDSGRSCETCGAYLVRGKITTRFALAG